MCVCDYVYKYVCVGIVVCVCARACMCNLNEVTSVGITMFSKSHRLNQAPRVIGQGVQETPQTIQVISIALGCPPEVKSKFLSLKTPHILDKDLEG